MTFRTRQPVITSHESQVAPCRFLSVHREEQQAALHRPSFTSPRGTGSESRTVDHALVAGS